MDVFQAILKSGSDFEIRQLFRNGKDFRNNEPVLKQKWLDFKTPANCQGLTSALADL
jgi:hypothetical protein